MPLVKATIYTGKSRDYKAALLDGIHKALVDSFKIPDADRNQRLYELDDEHFERRSNKSRNFTIIEMVVFKGRSFEAKKKLYAGICTNLAGNPGIDSKDILIVLNEQPKENWGVNGKPSSEVELGFEIEV
jgi:phenylpyruvate tautomerase PptA (4-oxalocrotonate tautomerase family)